MTNNNRNDLTSTVLTEGEFQQAIEAAKQAASAYYDTETLLMSDSEYDSLVDRITKAKQVHLDWDDAGVLTQVAAGASAGGSLRHPQSLLSLDKTTNPAAMGAFVSSVPGDVVVELKIDGNAIRATYVNKKLTALATRGDGVTGEPIDTAVQIDGLPTSIDLPGEVTLTGEVYMTVDDFDKSNANRIATGMPGFANPRNAAAGVLRRESRTFDAFLSFAAYHATSQYLDSYDDYNERMAIVGERGVRTVQALQAEFGLDFVATAEPKSVIADIDAMEAKRAQLHVGIDGAVVKAVSYDVRATMGAATRHPKWALAYKYPPMEATSYLDRIDVSVGRTGRMSLTGILKPPVELDGVTVARATLHNPTFIADQKLGIGSKVLVTRQGDVIPRIEAALGDKQSGLTPWTPPPTCPTCGDLWNTSEVIWRCETPSCSTVGRVTYAASRDVLDIEGLGVEVATALVVAGYVNDVADLFTLTADQVAGTQIGVTKAGNPRMIGALVAAKIVSGIEKAKSQPLNRILCSLGIPKMGQTMSRRLAVHFGTLEAIRHADAAAMSDVEGVADGKAVPYVEGLAAMSDVIDRMVTAGVTTEMKAAEPGLVLPLAGMRVVVTGSMAGSPLADMTRTQMHELIERAGGVASGSVSKDTSLLVCGETGSAKHTKALSLGVPVMEPADFASLLAPILAEPIA